MYTNGSPNRSATNAPWAIAPVATPAIASAFSYFSLIVRASSNLMKLLIPVCTALRREREQEIKRLAEHNEQFRNELTCYQNSQVNVEIMLKKNVAYKRLFHYDWLRQDIQEYLAKGE